MNSDVSLTQGPRRQIAWRNLTTSQTFPLTPFFFFFFFSLQQILTHSAIAAPSMPISPSTSPSPSPSPSPSISSSSVNFPPPSSLLPAKLPVDFSPPLIAMVVVIATAFLIVTYSRLISRHVIPPILQLIRFHRRRWRRWRRRRRRARSYLPSSSGGDLDSLPYDSPFFEHATGGFHLFSPYGLDESVIKTIPLSVYSAKSRDRECAVCLLEFEDDDYVRTLPICSHAFHVDCIDVWLRSHANCPLCRAVVFRPESPFTPLMAARIRPSLDETILRSIVLEPLAEGPIILPNRDSSYHNYAATESEITPCVFDEPRNSNSAEDRINGRDFLLKRSYSFGFERSLASERMILEPVTASPWRYRRGNNFWSKRASPFGSMPKARVFSFRYYRGMKSPFFRRRGGLFFPLSESSWRTSNGVGGGGSSRRSKSMTSPMFLRSSMGAAAYSSSRLRCGDPEALLSPERFKYRR